MGWAMPRVAASQLRAARWPALAGLAVLLGLLAGRAPVADAPADMPLRLPRSAPLALAFEIYAGGLHVFTSESVVTLQATGYEAALDIRADGWLAWLLDLKVAAKAEGASGPAGLVPRRFRSESQWHERRRWVEVTYGADGRPSTRAQPPPEEDDRDPVPEALRLGTIDPISAALSLLQDVKASGRCEGEAAIFDGRRRFAARASHAGSATLAESDLAPYGGPAIACRLVVEPLVGFWRNSEHPPKTQEVTVYLREVVGGWPPIPVRVEAETRFGAVRAHLVSAAPAARMQKAAASARNRPVRRANP